MKEKFEQLQMDLPEVNSEPTQEELIKLLTQTIIQQNEEIKNLKEELQNAKRFIAEAKEELSKPIDAENNSDQGYYTPWEKKVEGLYEHLSGEQRFYKEKINQIKHRLIETPSKKAMIKKELKFNKAHLKTIKAIMRRVIK